MRLCPALICVLVLSPAGAASASAQQSTPLGAECHSRHPGITASTGAHPYGPRGGEWWSTRCTGRAGCDQAWADHIRQWHSGSGGGPTPPIARPRTPAGKVVGATAVGAGMGVLLGSLATSTAGNNQWANGGMAAGGAMTVIAAISNAPKLPLAAGTVAAAAGGAASAYGVAKYNEEQGTLAAEKTPMVVGVTAAATAVTFVIAKVAGGSKPQWAPRFLGPRAQLDFPVSLRFTGVRLRW